MIHHFRGTSDVSDRLTALRQLLDCAPDAMVVVDSESRIAFANLRTEQLFGYAPEEILGKPLAMLIPERFRASHAEHTSRFFKQPCTRPMASGLELVGLRRDGAELPIEVSLSPVYTDDGIFACAAIRDIRDRKQIENAATRNADRLAVAIESVEDAVALYDSEERLVLCNSAYRQLVGSSLSGPIVGRSRGEIFEAWSSAMEFSTDAERESFCTERMEERGQNRSSFEVRTRDGNSLRVTNRRTADSGVVQTIWDLTEDVQRQRDLEEARRAAEAASAAKSDFLSSMSHELRTPLNSILGFAQLLQRDRRYPLAARHQDRVEHILKGGEHLLRLIDDVLDLARIETGTVSVSLEPISLREVFAEVKTILDTMSSRTGARVLLESTPEHMPEVIADRTRLKQVLLNYGSNAIKYGRSKGNVSLRAIARGEFVRVEVSDDGQGIAPEQQDKIFQPFHRAGQEAGPIEGTGIGLAITKRLAALMGGDVGFQSAEGKGSVFWIELPAYRGAAASLPAQRSSEEGNASRLAGSSEGRHVLVYVEDNPSNVAFMRDLLSDFEGVDLVTAPNAEVGLALIRSRRPSIVIMDINLPGMSGIEATRVLRQDPETREIPVIALSAAANIGHSGEIRDAGFYRFLTKPVKVDELTTALEELVFQAKPLQVAAT